MYKILVPTDFSDCSTAAVHYAHEWAKAMGNTEIYFLHSILLGKMIKDPEAPQQEKYLNLIESLEAGRDLFDRYLEKFDFEVPVHKKLIRGNPNGSIAGFAKSNNMDMIVMGTHGASGIRELTVGSTAQKVMRESVCPVVAIKEFELPLKVKNIVFASDFSNENLAAFKDTIEIAKKFDAQIHLLNVDTPGYFLEISSIIKSDMKDFAKLSPGNTHIHRISAWNVERGIEKFINEVSADLVVIPNHGRKGFKYLFVNSIAEGVVNHLKVPVLTTRVTEAKSDSIFTFENLKEFAD